jgi:hypothetical protein
MCEKFDELPYALPLGEPFTWHNTRVLNFGLLLTKVTHLRGGMYQSSRGFTYPMRRMVSDPNAIVGRHDLALHFGTTPESAARKLGSYGSHRLAVLPGRQVWDPVQQRGLTKRCWHAGSCGVLFCYDCAGVQLDVVHDPAFWRDLKLSPDYLSDDFIYSVWYMQKRVPVEEAHEQ